MRKRERRSGPSSQTQWTCSATDPPLRNELKLLARECLVIDASVHFEVPCRYSLIDPEAPRYQLGTCPPVYPSSAERHGTGSRESSLGAFDFEPTDQGCIDTACLVSMSEERTARWRLSPSPVTPPRPCGPQTSATGAQPCTFQSPSPQSPSPAAPPVCCARGATGLARCPPCATAWAA